MGNAGETTKRKLLDTTVALLSQTDDPKTITVRQIAKSAGVGLGLINYFFTSRDQLIHEAIALRMAAQATLPEGGVPVGADPREALEAMLIRNTDISMMDPKMGRQSAQYEMINGDFSVCLYLLPYLRLMALPGKTEADLRRIAYLIIIALQGIYLRQQAFHLYAGVDVTAKAERDALIHDILDTLLPKREEENK